MRWVIRLEVATGSCVDWGGCALGHSGAVAVVSWLPLAGYPSVGGVIVSESRVDGARGARDCRV